MRQPVRVEGQIGTSEMQRTRWSGFDHTHMSAIPPTFGASGNEALVVLTRYNALVPASTWPFLVLLDPSGGVSELWRVGPENRTQLGVSYAQAQCQAGVFGDDRLVCTAYDGVRTRITAVDPATGLITPVGTVDGQFTMYGRAATGWLNGWCDFTPVAIRLGTREIFAVHEDRLRTSAVAAADRWFAYIVGHPTVTIRLFPVDTE
jgi:hypothetical protein